MEKRKIDKHYRKGDGWISIPERVSGIGIPPPCVKLPKGHPCKGCVWYSRDTDVLYCPFPNCIRRRKPD